MQSTRIRVALHTYLFALEVFDPLEVFDRGVLRRYRAPCVLTA